ncbi:hypothetical protein FLAVO9R_110225 [Flavobacterium sp. 9R]|nr:hypothetical protein FLAVO9R_110225 [Flavobacterium sp. 9R]
METIKEVKQFMSKNSNYPTGDKDYKNFFIEFQVVLYKNEKSC